MSTVAALAHRSGEAAQAGSREGGRSIAIPAALGFIDPSESARCADQNHTPRPDSSDIRAVYELHARWCGGPEEIRLYPSKRERAEPVLHGLTSNIRLRLADHDSGRCRHTATGRPWKVIVVVAFANERRAIEFEKYLKSGSGCAFAVRYFR